MSNLHKKLHSSPAHRAESAAPPRSLWQMGARVSSSTTVAARPKRKACAKQIAGGGADIASADLAVPDGPANLGPRGIRVSGEAR
jgi:hypothetical protein